jgi:ATP-dependent RNA helicase DDX47/RRP3
LFRERVEEAARLAATELRNADNRGSKRNSHAKSTGRGDDQDRDDDLVEAGVPSRKPKRRRQ